MADTYWFCLNHHEVEENDGCAYKDRLGPYGTREEAKVRAARARGCLGKQPAHRPIRNRAVGLVQRVGFEPRGGERCRGVSAEMSNQRRQSRERTDSLGPIGQRGRQRLPGNGVRHGKRLLS